MTRTGRFLPRHLALACLFPLLAACGSGEPARQLNTGDIAPTFAAERATSGPPVHFPAGYAARPLVIRFWADWCRYCEGEMKAIEAVYQRHRERGLEVLAVNVGQDRKTVLAFGAKIGVSYPLLLDEPARIGKDYGVVGLPTTYFIDGKGVVRGKIVGEADEATFERHALALLK